MGIQGLLNFVKPASKTVHLSDLKGQTVAIDSYCWLHKGAFGCAEKIGKGEETDAYVQYCFKFIDMLRSFRITPIMVFDGQNLPAKSQTEKKRRETRKLAKKKAAECLKLGKLGEARMNFIKAVDITPDMALKLIKACRAKGIDCVVAPYEADAQLAYLNQKGIVDFIITEDSDLLVFGCKKVLFKLDLSGSGTLVESDKLFEAMNEKPDSFTIDKFRHMCILSGCDYIDSLPGIGLKKALKFLKANSNLDIYESLKKIPTSLNLKNVVVTEEYVENFKIADATFRHQLVFDPLNRKLVPLLDPEIYGTDPNHCCNAGKMMENKIALQLALGNLSPYDLKEMDSWCPDRDIKTFNISIWSKSYQLPEKRKSKIKEILPNTKNINVVCDFKFKIEEYSIKEEEKINKDIEKMYFEEPPTKKICLSSSQKENETSPVLNNKRVFVKSRFFCQDKVKIHKNLFSENNHNDIKNVTDDKINEIKCELIENDMKESIECELIEENIESSSASPSQKLTQIQIHSSCESVTNKFESLNCQQQNTPRKDSVFKFKSEIKETLLKKPVSSICTKSTVCRRPGLSRKNSTSKLKTDKSQTTISMFFSKT